MRRRGHAGSLSASPALRPLLSRPEAPAALYMGPEPPARIAKFSARLQLALSPQHETTFPLIDVRTDALSIELVRRVVNNSEPCRPSNAISDLPAVCVYI